MMTREEYMLQKQEIDELMKQTRIAEKKETAAVNEDYDLRLRDLSDAYRRQRPDQAEQGPAQDRVDRANGAQGDGGVGARDQQEDAAMVQHL